jgi:hypothetical protein
MSALSEWRTALRDRDEQGIKCWQWLGKPEISVLLGLLLHADEDCCVEGVKIERLAADLGRSERRVRDALHAAEAKGWVVIDRTGPIHAYELVIPPHWKPRAEAA